MSITSKFKYLHIFSHLCAAVGIAWVFTTGETHWLFIAFFAFLYAGIFGVNISLHRYFSHNSFKTDTPRYWLLLISSFFPMLGSPAAWGSIHRFHHAHSDREGDPHDPNAVGMFKSWFTVWPNIEIPLSLYRSFIKDKNVAWLDRNYFRLVVAYVLILGMIDWRLVCFVFAIPAVGCFHGAAAIAVIPHLNNIGGYRNHVSNDNSYNHPLAWVLSLGEGWHNNHHYQPKNYRHGEKWWEIDHSAFIIKFFLMAKTKPEENVQN